MDEVLKHQLIESLEDISIFEIHNDYTGSMRVNSINTIHNIIGRYRKITKKDLRENHEIFDEALDTTIPIEKYLYGIENCIKYVYNGNHPYMATHIINNFYNTVLAKGLYTDPSKMWHKNTTSDKMWEKLKKFFTEEYHDLKEIQFINSTQAWFHGSNTYNTIKSI